MATRTYVRKVIFGLCILALPHCGTSATPIDLSSLTNTTNTTNTTTACGQSSPTISAQVVGTPVLNTPVQVQVSATYCSGATFQVSGDSQFFSSTATVNKPAYSAAGNYSISITVNAYLAGSPLVAASASTTLPVSIASSTSTTSTNSTNSTTTTTNPNTTSTTTNTNGWSTSPNSTPAPLPPAPVPAAAQVAPVTALGAPIQIVLSATGGPLTAMTLNGVAAQPGVQISLLPVASNSPVYSATIVASGPGGSTSLQKTFDIPSCSLSNVGSTVSVAAAPQATITATLNYGGAPSQYSVNGNPAIAIPQVGGALQISSIVAYSPGPNSLTVQVADTYGNRTSCSAPYTQQTRAPLSLSNSSQNYFNGLVGFPPAAKTVLTGYGTGGIADQNIYTAATINANIVIGSPYNFVSTSTSHSCPSGSIMVGRAPGVESDYPNQLICQAVAPGVSLVNAADHAHIWYYNVFQACPAGQILLGLYYNGQGYYITCATPQWAN